MNDGDPIKAAEPFRTLRRGTPPHVSRSRSSRLGITYRYGFAVTRRRVDPGMAHRKRETNEAKVCKFQPHVQQGDRKYMGL